MGLCVIWGVGLMYCVGVAADLSAFHLLGGMGATLLSTVTFLRCALADPGILQPGPSCHRSSGGPIQVMPSAGHRECAPCGIVQPRGVLHCEYCEVCIDGWDHHCPWMS